MDRHSALGEDSELNSLSWELKEIPSVCFCENSIERHEEGMGKVRGLEYAASF